MCSFLRCSLDLGDFCVLLCGFLALFFGISAFLEGGRSIFSKFKIIIQNRFRLLQIRFEIWEKIQGGLLDPHKGIGFFWYDGGIFVFFGGMWFFTGMEVGVLSMIKDVCFHLKYADNPP